MKTILFMAAAMLLFSQPFLADDRPRIICQECQKNGIKSTVWMGGCMSTLIAGFIQFDEDGNQLPYKNPNVIHCNFTCSNGHHWNEALK